MEKSAPRQFEGTKAEKWLTGREVSRTVIGLSCLYLCMILLTVHSNFNFGISMKWKGCSRDKFWEIVMLWTFHTWTNLCTSCFHLLLKVGHRLLKVPQYPKVFWRWNLRIYMDQLRQCQTITVLIDTEQCFIDHWQSQWSLKGGDTILSWTYKPLSEWTIWSVVLSYNLISSAYFPSLYK